MNANSGLKFYSFSDRASMPYLEFSTIETATNFMTIIPPVQHIRIQEGRKGVAPPQTFQKMPAPPAPRFHPPSIHHSFINSFPVSNSYTVYSKPVPVPKKSVRWNDNSNKTLFTYSKDDYDRSIDNEQIRENVTQRHHYRMMKINPNMRTESVFQYLSDLNFD